MIRHCPSTSFSSLFWFRLPWMVTVTTVSDAVCSCSPLSCSASKSMPMTIRNRRKRKSAMTSAMARLLTRRCVHVFHRSFCSCNFLPLLFHVCFLLSVAASKYLSLSMSSTIVDWLADTRSIATYVFLYPSPPTFPLSPYSPSFPFCSTLLCSIVLT